MQEKLSLLLDLDVHHQPISQRLGKLYFNLGVSFVIMVRPLNYIWQA